jgi:hypothetical protein
MYRSAYNNPLTEEYCVRCEVLTALTMKAVSWDVALRCLVENYHLQEMSGLCVYDTPHGASYHKTVVFIVTAMGPHLTQQFLSFTYQNALS